MRPSAQLALGGGSTRTLAARNAPSRHGRLSPCSRSSAVFSSSTFATSSPLAAFSRSLVLAAERCYAKKRPPTSGSSSSSTRLSVRHSSFSSKPSHARLPSVQMGQVRPLVAALRFGSAHVHHRRCSHRTVARSEPQSGRPWVAVLLYHLVRDNLHRNRGRSCPSS